MNDCLLTIAIPNFNGEKKLERAIRSCQTINLSKKRYEVLVIDNCSEDGSVEIVKKLKKEFSNIRLEINKKNLGRIGNWNRCLELSKGKYLLFLMVNDYYTDKFSSFNLSNLLEDLKNQPKTAVMFDLNIVDEKGRVKGYDNHGIISEKNSSFKEFTVSSILNSFFRETRFRPGSLQSLMIKKSVLSKKDTFDLKLPYYSDLIFIVKYLSNFEKMRLYKLPIINWEMAKTRKGYCDSKPLGTIKLERLIAFKKLKKQIFHKDLSLSEYANIYSEVILSSFTKLYPLYHNLLPRRILRNILFNVELYRNILFTEVLSSKNLLERVLFHFLLILYIKKKMIRYFNNFLRIN